MKFDMKIRKILKFFTFFHALTKNPKNFKKSKKWHQEISPSTRSALWKGK